MSTYILGYIRSLGYLATLLLVVAAIILSILRGLFAFSDNYLTYLTQWVDKSYHIDLKIDKLSADWIGFKPVINLYDTSFNTKTVSRAYFQQLKVIVNPWQSLINWQLTFDHVLMYNSTLQLMTPPVQIISNKITQLNFSTERLLENIKELTIIDAQVDFRDPIDQFTGFYLDSLHWSSRTDRYRVNGSVNFDGHNQKSNIDFILDTSSSDDDTDDLQGQLYADISQLQLSPWLINYLDAEKLERLSITGQAWIGFSSQGINDALLDLKSTELVWQQEGKWQQLIIESGMVNLNKQNEFWQLLTEQMQCNFSTKYSDAFPLELQLNASKQKLRGLISHLKAETVTKLLMPLMPKRLQQVMQKVSPKGDISSIEFAVDDELIMQATINELSTQAWQFIPAVKGLSAQLYVKDNQGKLSLGLTDNFLSLDYRFDQSLPQFQWHGDIFWQWNNTGINISTNRILATTDDLHTVTEFNLELPYNSTPWLSLYSEVNMHDISKVHQYLPTELVKSDVRNYLTDALLAGKAAHSRLLWHGSVMDFPYKKQQGIFQAQIDLQQTMFQFHPDWLAVELSQFNLLFENEALYMEGYAAPSHQAAAVRAKVKASIPQLSKQAVLSIDADISGSGQEINTYLQASPLDNLAQTLTNINVQQKLTGYLNLQIRLFNKKVTAQGQVNFLDNQVTIHADKGINALPLTQVTGQLYFKDQKIWTNNWIGQWLQQPVKFSFQGDRLADLSYQVNITASGIQSVAELTKQYHKPLLNYFQGSAPWSSIITINTGSEAGFNYIWQLDSLLQGISSSLPYPLAKQKNELWPLTLSAVGNSIGADFNITIKEHSFYQGRVDYLQHSLLLTNSWTYIGNPSLLPRRPNSQHGLTIHLAKLNAAPWVNLISNSQPAALSGILSSFTEIQINTQELTLFEQKFPKMNYHYLSLGSQRQHRFNSPLVTGKILWDISNNTEPITFDFDRLVLKDIKPQFAKQQSLRNNGLNWLKNLNKKITFTCSECQFKQFNLGKIKALFNASSNSHSIVSETINIENAGGTLMGSVIWDWRGGLDKTEITGALTMNSAEQILLSLGYLSPLRDTPGQFNFAIDWHGSPFSPVLKTITGNMSLDAGEGVLTEASNQGAWIFALASLETVWRRLRLDFRDVFEDGLFYTNMNGNFVVKQGVIQGDDFAITGAIGNVNGQGKIDFVQDNIDYLFQFYPNVTSSLPMIAAFAVTPVTGLAVLVLSQLFNPLIEVITEVSFQATGSILQPKIKELGRTKGRVSLLNDKPVNSYEK